jgi:hypothetical protein
MKLSYLTNLFSFHIYIIPFTNPFPFKPSQQLLNLSPSLLFKIFRKKSKTKYCMLKNPWKIP